jgi:hypothetical protein
MNVASGFAYVSETSSQLTPPSSGESGANSLLGKSHRCPLGNFTNVSAAKQRRQAIFIRGLVPQIAYTIEAVADPFLRSGQLVRVLEDWSPSFDGLFLYYPGHRQVPVALRALIDMLRSPRGAVPAAGRLARDPLRRRLNTPSGAIAARSPGANASRCDGIHELPSSPHQIRSD